MSVEFVDVKRQHYVWREYLRGWSIKDNKKDIIWTYLIKDKKLIQNNLMAQVQQKYFYSIKGLNLEQIIFLKDFLLSFPNSKINEFNLELLNKFEKISILNLQNENIFNEKYEELNNNILEYIHKLYEVKGNLLLNIKNKINLAKILEDDVLNFDFLIFIAVQYSRTKKMKEYLYSNVQNTKFEILVNKSVINIISIFVSNILAYNLLTNYNSKYILYKFNDKCKGNFITCDQPIINIAKNTELDLELYYPISPNLSLLLHFDTNQIDKIVEEEIDEDRLLYLNNKVIENAHLNIFASTKEELEFFIKK